MKNRIITISREFGSGGRTIGKQLAERLEVSRQSVSKWEGGQSFPEMDTILRLCDMFRVSMDTLLRGDAQAEALSDTAGYDRFMNGFTWKISLSIGAILVGAAVMSLMEGLGVPWMLYGGLFFTIVAAAVTVMVASGIQYDNFRKRSAREQDAAFGNGVAHAVSQILSILDTLEMAEAAPTADENFKKGVTLTLEKAKAAFEALKVEEIPALGLPFDPAVHNAVMQKAAENGEESGTVLQVFQKGYKLGDKVIRHATVIVAE